MTTASASGKVILFGEHAVVYGRPAIAVPVSQARAHAHVENSSLTGDIRVIAPDLGQQCDLSETKQNNPLAQIVSLTLAHLGLDLRSGLTVTVRADLPVARGMGSGAAVSTAIVRALAAHFGQCLDPEAVSALVFEVEKLYHGTPSGIDNTVIAFERPVYFVKGRPPETFPIHTPFSLVIADTGIVSSTREVVEDVRRAWEQDRTWYDAVFDEIGCIAPAGRECIEGGDLTRMGRLMDENHRLLQQIGVSSRELDRLVTCARDAGSLGAKLCGAGRGGNMIALSPPERVDSISDALFAAGAAGVITTVVR